MPAEARTLAGRGVTVHVCGPGQANARSAVRRCLAGGPDLVLSWGIAAGLGPGLAPGALLLPEAITVADGRQWPAAGTGGSLLSVSEPVLTARDKQALWRATGCHGADMESAAIASACRSREVTFMAVRAVADPAERDLPGWLVDSLTAGGRPRLLALARRLVGEQDAIPALRQVRRDYRAALAALRNTAARLDELLDAAVTSRVTA